jgi:hypothetical protein
MQINGSCPGQMGWTVYDAEVYCLSPTLRTAAHYELGHMGILATIGRPGTSSYNDLYVTCVTIVIAMVVVVMSTSAVAFRPCLSTGAASRPCRWPGYSP